jgi:uncharacterized protein YggE
MRRQLNGLVIAASIAAAATPAAAQTYTVPQESLLTVTGEGTVRGRPDMALITLGVVSESRTAGDALAANSQAVSGITSELRAEGIASRDLQTAGFVVEPIYSQPPPDQDGAQPFRPEIVGYRVRNELSVRIRDLTKVGALLDKAVTLGANSISGPAFTVADPTPLEDQARRAAVRDAQRKAGLYAETARIRLGPIFRIDEIFVQPPQPLANPMMRMEAADSSVPIESGELAFTAQVTISWELAN